MKVFNSILLAIRENIELAFILKSVGFLAGFCFIVYQLLGRKPFKKNITYNILIMLIAVILSQGVFFMIRKIATASY